MTRLTSVGRGYILLVSLKAKTPHQRSGGSLSLSSHSLPQNPLLLASTYCWAICTGYASIGYVSENLSMISTKRELPIHAKEETRLTGLAHLQVQGVLKK